MSELLAGGPNAELLLEISRLATELEAEKNRTAEAQAVAVEMAGKCLVYGDDDQECCRFCGEDWEDEHEKHAPTCPVLKAEEWKK